MSDPISSCYYGLGLGLCGDASGFVANLTVSVASLCARFAFGRNSPTAAASELAHGLTISHPKVAHPEILKLKLNKALGENSSLSYGASPACHMGSHSVTRHPTQVNAPRLNPSH